jgi:hypothetical protein
MPAFSAFTGGLDTRAGEDERLFVIEEDTVVELPPARSGRRSRS